MAAQYTTEMYMYAKYTFKYGLDIINHGLRSW